MKFNKLFLLMALAVFAISFASCSDEGKWDAYEAEGEAYSFAQDKSSMSFTAGKVPSELVVEVYRNNSAGSVTLPVTFETDNAVLSAPSTVTFVDGSNVAEYVISVGEIPIGTTIAASVAFDNNNVSASGKSSYNLTVKVDYTWVNAGSCTMYSDWAGAEAVIPIQKAAEYDGNLYRLNSPYFYLEPSYCPEEGYHIQFYLDDNGNALGMPLAQQIGEYVDGYGWFYYYYKEGAYDWCLFSNEGNVFTMNFLWAYSEDGESLSLYDYAQEIFVWDNGYPGE